MNTQQSQSGIFPQFFIEAVQHKAKSEEAGRPIFIDQERVKILIAGDSKTEVVRKVTDEHRTRWPDQYAAFKKGLEQPVEGTPLKHCPLFTPAEIRTMQGANIFTVESLAELNDGFITKLGMGARGWVAKAQAYLKQAAGSADITHIAAENERMKQEIEFLKEQIRELGNIKPVEPAPAEVSGEAKTISEDVSIDDIGLSPRTVTALKKAGIETQAALLALKTSELNEIPGIGLGAVDEISKLYEAVA